MRKHKREIYLSYQPQLLDMKKKKILPWITESMSCPGTAQIIPPPHSQSRIPSTIMRIQLASDLHLRTSTYKYSIKSVVPDLALLGDIGSIANPLYLSWLTRHLFLYRRIFFIYGNNEPYNSSWAATKACMRTYQSTLMKRRANGEKLGELIILDQGRYDLPDSEVTILGVTLYTHVLTEQEESVLGARQEFHRIRNWNVGKHNAAHASDVAWLNAQIVLLKRTQPSRRIVILSHYSPTSDERTISPCIQEAVRHGTIKNIGSGFFSDLSKEKCWEKGNGVVCWAWGHTHFNVDYKDHERRLVSNQAEDVRPERAEKKFDAGFVLEI